MISTRAIEFYAWLRGDRTFEDYRPSRGELCLAAFLAPGQEDHHHYYLLKPEIMGEVKTEFTSDIKRLEKAYDEMDKRNRKLAAQLAELKDKSKQANDTQQGGMQGTIVNLAKMAAGYASVTAAVGMLLAAERERSEFQAKSKSTQLSAADSQREALFNLGKATQAEQAAFIKRAEGIAKRRGTPIAQVYAASGGALAANDLPGSEHAMANTDLAFRLMRGESAIELAGALGMVGSATKQTNPLVNLDLLNTMGAQTQIENLSMIARNLPGPLAGMVKLGDSPEAAAALLTGITKSAKDKTGASTGTNVLGLGMQLEAFLPAENTYGYDSKGKRKLDRKGTGLDSTEERIRYLQENARAREEFLSTATFEKQFTIPFRDLLSGGDTAKLINRFKGDYLSGDAAAASAESFVASMDAPELQRTAKGVHARAASREGLQLGDTSGAIKADIQENLGEDLYRIGVGFMDRQFLKMEYAFSNEDPLAKFESILANREQTLTGQHGTFAGMGTAEAKEWLVITREMLEQIRGMRQDSKTRLPATETHTE